VTTTAARLLVVDDERPVLDGLRLLFNESGYEVACEQTGEGCIERLATFEPNLLVLDLRLGEEADGYRLIERIKRDPAWRDLPIVALSGLPPEEATVRALGLGAADFIRKPFRPRELLARVQAHLRQGAVLRAMRAELARAESALARAEADVETRRTLVDILHEVTGDLSVPELYHLLVRRAARALDVSHCSVIIARPGAETATVVAAVENPAVTALAINLDRYPELQSALETGQPVLAEDIHSHPLYENVREVWSLEGIAISIRSVIALPFTIDRGEYGVFLVRRTLEQPPFATDDLEFAREVVTAAVAVIQRARTIERTRADNARLEQLALTDPLTQLLNRRALTETVTAEMERALRYDAPMAVLMVDLDHFKRVNDTHGHLVGDDVLRDLAALLRTLARTTDVVARYGGEEFVLLLPETDEEGALGFAERIRKAVAATPFAAGDIPDRPDGLTLTASLGLATFPAARIGTVDELLARADSALYRAKAAGRDRVST
jgi:two-component system cell cycle response regulator